MRLDLGMKPKMRRSRVSRGFYCLDNSHGQRGVGCSEGCELEGREDGVMAYSQRESIGPLRS